MNTCILRVMTAAIALVGSVALWPQPAQADSGAFADTTAGVAAESIDITHVSVASTCKRIAVRIHVRDLPRAWDGDRRYEVWIDSAKTQKKPDFYMGAVSLELYAGHTKGWDMIPGRIPGTPFPDPYGGLPVHFSKSAAGDYVALSMPARAIGRPHKVRVAVKTEKWNRGSADSTDHLGKRRQFTAWVTR